MSAAAEFAARAVLLHGAMERRFFRSDGLARRSEGGFHLPWAIEHLWPLARAVVATLDVAGIPAELRAEFEAEGAIARRFGALERYWAPPAYASDVHRTPWGGDRYYDDNAWVGLSLVELERLFPGTGRLARAAELFRFAADGWDSREDVPGPGGVFWIEQGRGTGRRNHDRNTVSNAPNAELGLHVAELTGDPAPIEMARRMHAWVRRNLRSPGGLYWDKIRGDGSIDQALWSYNQGSMIGAAVLLHRLSGDPERLREAEEDAQLALDHYAGAYFSQPPAFNAIFFRNLLLLHAATANAGLRATIMEALGAYAEEAWERHRDEHDLFVPPHGSTSLLDQSAFVSVHALLAWPDSHYRLLA